MPDTQAFLVATTLVRALEQASLAITALDRMTALRLALLTSEWWRGAAR
jgi:hypothetical protein